MTEYTFPFSTCEIPNKEGIAQPYSAFVNLLTCSIIFYFLIKTKTFHSLLLLLSILVFESFHVFSHIVHIPGPLQINITHLLTYCMNVGFLNLFYHSTKVFPSHLFLIYMIGLILIDIYAFTKFSFVYYLASQSLIFISILFYYFPLLPKYLQRGIYIIFSLVIFVIVLFLNEKYNCEHMFSLYPHFPYHIIIEITGVCLFYVICSNFYKL